ncbi:BamA/TamA family outer membrane protein [Sediminispirochaeta smaragdinae]|uniref:Uncharacterized protein n=1 Tax=Sediminispirochaeta smaragdinae (strain DSM 11293 / JCM 15392 / SEBR 4228) TaxID=573413 RepID=E1R9Y0_SEDSS|nr:hypothetical protein [Sediminispirochaeta smaragdinae]ADK83299.1 hypothetical protein Spirs_4225 [Sediminispirochaeta smaragdinae DSM 11293]
MNRFFLMICVVLFTAPLFAQELPIKIGKIDYTIEGRTQERLLDDYLDFDKKRLFANEEELAAYLVGKSQELINLRILDTGSIEISDLREEGDVRIADLAVYAEDTWNVVVLPYGKYDSNDGLLLSLRGRDYNFLGSMEALKFNLDYSYNEDNEHELGFTNEAEIPFTIGNGEWVYNFSQELQYVEHDPLEYDLENSISYLFSLGDISFKTALEQNMYLQNSYDDDDDEEQHESYMESALWLNGSVPLGFSLAHKEAEYSGTPGISWCYGLGETLREERRGLTAYYDHSLSFGRIDWIGNFRRGLEFDLSEGNSYDTFDDHWTFDMDFTVAGHQTWGWGGVNSRVGGFYIFSDGDDRDDQGGPLRGVLDDDIDDTTAGLYMNLDFPFKMWIWFMSRWFEGHISPFFDAAMFRTVDDGFSSDNVYYTAGLEGFAFAKAARSLYLRVSVGIDLKAVIEDGASPLDSPELFIGLGHHY